MYHIWLDNDLMLLSLDFGLFQIILLNPMSHQFTSVNYTPSRNKGLSEDCRYIILMSCLNSPPNQFKM